MLKLAGLAACALNLAAPAPMSSTNEIGVRQVQIPDTGPEHKVNQMRATRPSGAITLVPQLETALVTSAVPSARTNASRPARFGWLWRERPASTGVSDPRDRPAVALLAGRPARDLIIK